MRILFHRDLGGAGLPPLVLLHGMLGSSRNWLTTGADLAAKHHVLAPDLRNHGRSFHDAAMDYDTLCADVVEWMDVHARGPVTLVGHSMGGKTAMLLACRHPLGWRASWWSTSLRATISGRRIAPASRR